MAEKDGEPGRSRSSADVALPPPIPAPTCRRCGHRCGRTGRRAAPSVPGTGSDREGACRRRCIEAGSSRHLKDLQRPNDTPDIARVDAVGARRIDQPEPRVQGVSGPRLELRLPVAAGPGGRRHPAGGTQPSSRARTYCPVPPTTSGRRPRAGDLLHRLRGRRRAPAPGSRSHPDRRRRPDGDEPGAAPRGSAWRCRYPCLGTAGASRRKRSRPAGVPPGASADFGLADGGRPHQQTSGGRLTGAAPDRVDEVLEPHQGGPGPAVMAITSMRQSTSVRWCCSR